MRNFQKVVALIALSGMCLAAPLPSEGDAAAKKHAKKHAAAAKKECMTADQVRELKEAVQQQQAATQQLQQQLQQTQQQLQQTQQQVSQAQAGVSAQDAKIATVETNTNLKVQKVESDLSDVKAAMAKTEALAEKTAKEVAYLEQPNSIAYKGVRITPGGFLETTGYWRSHSMLSDQATQFQAIPLGTQVNGGYNANLTETGITARDSRIALRADADAGTTKLAGYFEMDFFGAAPTANANQTSSFNPRMRQGWGRAKFANGWTITAGQMWNLITLNRKGTDADNSNLWIPNIIEAQYAIGYDWGRFAELRINKTLTPAVNFAVGITNPAYLSLNQAGATVSGIATAGNGLLANTANFSTNLAPDLVAKLTYDNAKVGHFEVKALGRFFRDRVVSTATVAGYNNTTEGGGVGAGAVIPVVAKKIDFIAQGLWGKGISRYEDAGQYDFVVRSTDHNMQPLKSFSVLTGFETHPNRKTEFDVLFGEEYYYRDMYTLANGTISGYGSPTQSATVNNLGCVETPATGQVCTGYNKDLWNAKVIGYYDLYKGPVGTLRYGAEFDYDQRQTWEIGGIAPKGNLKTAFTTMRYILP